MTPLPDSHLHAFYTEQLFDRILPFWMRHGVDRTHGGFYTCFTNRGDRRLFPHKFTWSQGRFVWMLARLVRNFAGRRPQAEVQRFREAAVAGARFLADHARLPNGACAFILTEQGAPTLLAPNGAPRQAGPGERYDTSIYADCFVVYGLAECALAVRDRAFYEFAVSLYDSVVERFYEPVYRTDPYPVPPGFEAHGRPMILLETAREMALAAAGFGDPRETAFLDQAAGWMDEILDRFRDPADGLIAEMRSDDPVRRASLLGQYINPGHMIESMGFVIQLARTLNRPERIAQAVDTIRAACRIGWDVPFGGFPQYLHRTGGAPRGSVPPELAGQEMIRKLQENWDNKLWWPHSEALFALLLAAAQTGEPDLMDWYAKAHDYTFATFPNPDPAIGEWIQIRTRDGQPVDKIVALPVKDPFHITRAFLLILELLERRA